MTEPGISQSVDMFKKMIVPHHKYLTHASIVKGNVKEVTPENKVSLRPRIAGNLLDLTRTCYRW